MVNKCQIVAIFMKNDCYATCNNLNQGIPTYKIDFVVQFKLRLMDLDQKSCYSNTI